MRSIEKRIAVSILSMFFLVGSAYSQDVGKSLKDLAIFGQSAVKGWVSPLASGFGNGLNTAIYHSADLHDILGFDIGLKLGVAPVQDADKTYTLNTPPSISLTVPYGGTNYTVALTRGIHYAATLTPNTAMGDGTATPFRLLSAAGPGGIIPAGTELLPQTGGIPGGVSLPVSGAFAFQAALGLPFGVEVFGRMLPTYEGDAGKFGMTGFGLRYDIDQWLPLFPIDIAVHFASQKFTLKDKNDTELLSASATAYGVEASKRFLFITLYAGFQLESSTIKVGDIVYNGFVGTVPTTLKIDGFEIEGSNSSRFTVGARVLLLFLNIHAEYSLASTPMIGLGAGISFR